MRMHIVEYHATRYTLAREERDMPVNQQPQDPRHQVVPMTGLTGQNINGLYTLGPQVGRGGMATIYSASMNTTGKEVAIKFPHLVEEDAGEKGNLRFLQEIQITHKLPPKNPHLVQFLGAGITRINGVRFPYLVLEFLRGNALHRVLRSTASSEMSVSVATLLAHQLARALAACHDAHIVHRDVREENIFLAETGHGIQLVLMDFGISYEIGSARLTPPGIRVGATESMAPEQKTCDATGQGQRGDPSADIYQLGLILHRLLQHRQDTSLALFQFMQSCLKGNPSERPTAIQAIDKLGELLSPSCQLPEAFCGKLTFPMSEDSHREKPTPLASEG